MTLDEQLRTLADQVPAAPTADPVELYTKGRGRRRRRRAAGAGGALVLVAALTLSVAQFGGVGLRPEVVDAPTLNPGTVEPPVVVGEAVAAAIGTEPFPYSLGLAPSSNGNWCVVGLGSEGQLETVIDQPCGSVLLPDRTSDPDRVSTAAITSIDLPDQQASGRLLYGFAPEGTEEVVLRLSDGTRIPGAVADDPVEDNVLFGVGWVDTVGVDPVEIEARGPYGDVVEPVAGGGVSAPSLELESTRSLRAGGTIDVHGNGWDPGADVFVAECETASVNAGAPPRPEDACDMPAAVSVRVDEDGTFTASIAGQTVIGVGTYREILCPSEGCSVGVGYAAEDTVTATTPLRWPPDASVPDAPTLSLEEFDLPPGAPQPADIQVSGRGFAPDSDVRLTQCPRGRDARAVDADECLYDDGAIVTADGDGTFTVTMTVWSSFERADGELVDCRATPAACVIATPWPPEGTRMALVTLAAGGS